MCNLWNKKEKNRYNLGFIIIIFKKLEQKFKVLQNYKKKEIKISRLKVNKVFWNKKFRKKR